MASNEKIPKIKIPFTKHTFGLATREQIRADLMQSEQSVREFRQEISRVFQVANRRIQNIENSGLFSPAVSALGKGDIDKYSKFSMSGKDWTDLKIEYGKAVSFLRQPTSTVTGVRQYNKHLQTQYDLTDEEFSLMSKELNNELLSLRESNFVEKYLMRYKDFTGELEQSARDISSQLESEAKSIQRAIDDDIEKQAREISLYYKDTPEEVIKILKDLGKFGV